ncbi:unnamed protein product, partial [Porites lobata]
MSWACLVSLETVPKDEKFSASRKDIKGKKIGFVFSKPARYVAPPFAKVGFTNNCQERLQNLQAGNPFQMTCYQTFHVCKKKDAEKAAHKEIGRYRVQMRGGTEWFFYISL